MASSDFDFKKIVDLDILDDSFINSLTFLDAFDFMCFVVKNTQFRLPLIQYFLSKSKRDLELMRFKEYFIFREACLFQKDLTIIMFLSRQYFIPLNCCYETPFINACKQGNYELILFLIDGRAGNWENKYYKAIRALVVSEHFDLLFRLIRELKDNIKKCLQFDNEFIFRYLVQHNKYLEITEYDKIAGPINFRIENDFALRKSVSNGALQLFTWLEGKYDHFTFLDLIKSSNKFFLKSICTSGNVEMLRYFLKFIEEPPSELFLTQICKTCLLQGKLQMIELIRSEFSCNLELEIFVADFNVIKAENSKIKEIVYFYDGLKKLSQEIFIESFYTAIYNNNIEMAEFYISFLNEVSKIFLLDDVVLSKFYTKMNLDTCKFLTGKFPDMKKYFIKYQKEYFVSLIIKNNLEDAKKLQSEHNFEAVNDQNIIFLLDYACTNDNTEMVEFLMGSFQASNYIRTDSFSKVCENGNLDIIKMIISHVHVSDISKGFSTACSFNNHRVANFLYTKYSSLIDLNATLLKLIYTMLLIENIEIFQWFSEKINLHHFFKNYLQFGKLNTLFEGICAGNSFELLRWIQKYVKFNNTNMYNIIKWSCKYNQENILLEMIQIYNLYDIDPNYIFKMAMIHKNYFIAYSEFYRSNRDRGRFNEEMISFVLEQAIMYNNFDVFQILFHDYDMTEYIHELFELAYEKQRLEICKMCFQSVYSLSQYNLVKKSIFDRFQFSLFLFWLRESYPKYRNLVYYDIFYKKFYFIDRLSFFYANKNFNDFIEYLSLQQLRVPANSIESRERPQIFNLHEKECSICLEPSVKVMTNCKHFYCTECFVEYVYKYENFSCGMCRQKMIFNQCYYLK